MELTSVFFCILEAHHQTQRSICRIIGFRSANQLTRILKGAVSDDLMLDFGRRLIEHSEGWGSRSRKSRPFSTAASSWGGEGTISPARSASLP